MIKGTKKTIVIYGIFIIVSISGCGETIPMTEYVAENELETQNLEQDSYKDGEGIAEIYCDSYKEAIENNGLDSLEVERHIINRLGQEGYSAVDNKNQIDMVGAERVKEFCEKVDAKSNAELSIISILDHGGFIKFDFKTSEGAVAVSESYALGRDGVISEEKKEYQAYSWNYTEEGYLFFEEYHMAGYDGPSGHIALRVQPLDEVCRELNQKYILPVGYELNNLFLQDWSENDFEEVNFYDLFDVFYERIKESPIPYVADSNCGVGAIYNISKEEFEEIIMTYFKISSEALQAKTTYFSENQTYEYRPRGLYDCEPPSIPYPEVVNFVENEDGTITLVVNAVFPDENTSKAYSHEVVIRPLQDKEFQYVSNRIIPSENSDIGSWHEKRLTEEQWAEYYEEEVSSLITEEEKKELQNIALSAAEKCAEVYKDVKIAEPHTSYSYIETFNDAHRIKVVDLLGKQGFVSVSENINMENYQKMEKFYADYSSGKDTMITVFQIYKNGNLSALTFAYRKEKILSYYVSIGWLEGGIPEIKSAGVNNLEEIKLTEKGYFIYTNTETVVHGNLREYFRVKALSNECRELTEKYISGLSFVNYNMLVTNWNSDNVEEILMPCMFEDIYRIDTGENIEVKNGRISADLYEKIMTTYFPLTKGQVRNNCGYEKSSDSYWYEMIFASQFPPFGEVIAYTENKDGSITLIVDGVWPDYNSDCAFTNKIVVQPFEDGTFRYLSNSIEEKELELPHRARE